MYKTLVFVINKNDPVPPFNWFIFLQYIDPDSLVFCCWGWCLLMLLTCFVLSRSQENEMLLIGKNILLVKTCLWLIVCTWCFVLKSVWHKRILRDRKAKKNSCTLVHFRRELLAKQPWCAVQRKVRGCRRGSVTHLNREKGTRQDDKNK